HAGPVSVHHGQHILVTEYVPGRPGDITAEHERALADGLGRLHGLPVPAPTSLAGRDGGAFGHDPAHEGRPVHDVRASLGFLDAVRDQVAPDGRPLFDSLYEDLAGADAGEGLPEALT